MNILFEDNALEEYTAWALENKKIFNKLVSLIREVKRTPYIGTGKPEPLKHDKSGLWSRRITDEHRLIYKIENDIVIIKSCKGHYDDK
jgi:toxin YoeB